VVAKTVQTFGVSGRVEWVVVVEKSGERGRLEFSRGTRLNASQNIFQIVMLKRKCR
jgi:hypothetical protein